MGYPLGHDVESIPHSAKEEYGMAIIRLILDMTKGKKVSYAQALAILDHTKQMVGEYVIRPYD